MPLPSPSRGGFTLVEVLVSIALAAVVFSAAAMIHQNVSANASALGIIENVTLGEEVLENFYGLTQDDITVMAAPNYGRAAFADVLAQTFQADVLAANAVYCLGRNDLNVYRPATIPYPDGSAVLDSPERFRLHLVANATTAQSNPFVSYETLSAAQDATIFLIQESSVRTELNVLAVYDIDIVPVTGVGNYVAVRRYVGGTLTNYYDIVFPAATGTAFSPLAVHFFRRGLASDLASAFDQRFAIAEEMPFYFVWWPDPAAHTLESPINPPTPAVTASNPVLEYFHMGGRTRYMFTVPAFPSQL